MSRDFRPKRGFEHQEHVAIRITDEGHSQLVNPDGSVTDTTTVFGGQVRQRWTLQELDNLVKSGAWEEVSPDDEPVIEGAMESAPTVPPIHETGPVHPDQETVTDANAIRP